MTNTKPLYIFGDIVVVPNAFIGVVLKTWGQNPTEENGYIYEVYVRKFNAIVEYEEKSLQRYTYNKVILQEELENYELGDQSIITDDIINNIIQ